MDNKKSKKGLIIGISVGVVALIATIVLLIIVLNKEEAYRIIKVYEVDGEAVVTREGIGEIEAYSNMVLESGDNIYLKTGTMTLKLDDDKYVYVEENTEFELVATGSATNSKTSIDLKKGAITNEIQNKLSDESSYEVNTPNSNMAVRGTVFRVCIYEENGVLYTRVSVFDGEVATKLKYKDGTYASEIVAVPNGKEVIIYEDGKTTDYLEGLTDINYDSLPEKVVQLIEEILGNIQNDASTEEDESTDNTEDTEEDTTEEVTEEEDTAEETTEEETGPFTVTFMYNGKVFGTQTVEKYGVAQVPSLMPAAGGSWDFDFTTPITEDTVIEWR